MDKKTGLGHRIRLWWHRRKGLTRAAAQDLIDGIDLGDRPCAVPARPLCGGPPRPRRGGPTPPACPGLLTVAGLERLDRAFLAGGPVRDAVVRGIERDLKNGKA